MSVVFVSSTYRVTLPRDIREKLCITPRQRFAVTERDGSIVLTPVPDDPIGFLRGCLAGGPSLTQELLQERARDLQHE